MFVRFKNLLILTFVLGAAISAAEAQTALKFDFGAGKTEKGYTPVSEKDVYAAEKASGSSRIKASTAPTGTIKTRCARTFVPATNRFIFPPKSRREIIK